MKKNTKVEVEIEQYSSIKTETSYIVTYKGITKEFMIYGNSYFAWNEALNWMKALDNVK